MALVLAPMKPRSSTGVWIAMKLALAGMMVLTVAVAEAGPYCGHTETFAPASETTLPVAPTLAMHVEHSYYAGSREKAADIPMVRATIDGKRVAFSTRDVSTDDGVIRFITIKSKATGTLALLTWNHFSKEFMEHTTYTIVNGWTAATPTASVHHAVDLRLAPYKRIGHAASVRVNIPAIAFTVRWRKDARAKWRTTTIAARDHEGASEAWLGQTMCGMLETVPLKSVETGIEIEVTATLPNGRKVRVTDGVPSPVVLPPDPDKPETKAVVQPPAP